ncbi:MAG: (Fe-S)-binding protein, partial [Gallionella sp.]
MADITAPAYRIIPIVPALKPGAMAGSGPYVANEKINEAIGFPGALVEDWHDKAIAKMGELLGKYRSLKVYMDACV